MEYRILGRTGMSVSRYCLGAMMFGGMGNRDHDDCVRIIHRALDAGINFIDTADVYSVGESEQIVGKALKDRRSKVILATKFYAPMGQDPNMMGGSRRWIMREVEASLKRLGTDYIDLYQIHRFDDNTDLEETMSALSDLTHQGKIRSFGSSMFPPTASSNRTSSPKSADCCVSAASSPGTRSSPARSSASCCRCASATAWA